MQELAGSFDHVLGIKPTGWTHEKGKQYSISLPFPSLRSLSFIHRRL